MRRSFVFAFVSAVLLFVRGSAFAVHVPSINPPPVDPGLISCGTYLPLDQQVSYFEVIGNTPLYWTDYIHLNVMSSGEMGLYYSGILLRFDTSRLPEDTLSRLRSARIYLTMAAPEDGELPNNVLVWKVTHLWTLDSFSSNCEPRYFNDIPVGFCYNSPRDLIDVNHPDIGYDDQELVKWLPLSYAEGRYALAIDVTDIVREGFPIGGFYIVAYGSEHEILFYGSKAPSPVLKAVLQVFYDSPCADVVCGDGICDYIEVCDEDCSVPTDFISPTVDLIVAPATERVTPDVNLAIVAQAQDDQGVDSITIYDQINSTLFHICRDTEECSFVGLASDFGLGRHRFCAQVEDINGNVSPPVCKEVWIGSNTDPEITLSNVPNKVHLGDHVSFNVTARDPEGIVWIKVAAGARSNPWEVVEYKPISPDQDLRFDFWFRSCSYPVKADDYVIEVTAKDAEGKISQRVIPLEVVVPIQAQYGLKPANFSQALSFPQMVKTFGEEDVFATVTICGEIAPVLFKCVDNDYCSCYIATPDSMAAHLLHGTYQTLIWEYLLDAIGVGDSILDYLGVDSLVDLGFPTLSALLVYPFYHEAASSGSCTGFVMTVANALEGNINPLAPEEIFEAPVGYCLNTLTQVGKECIRDYVGYHQGAVISKEFISHIIRHMQLSVRENLNLILRDLEQGKHPGVMILGFPDGSDCSKLLGHAMLVDWAEEYNSGVVDLMVYDPNRPNMSGKIDPYYPHSFDPGFDYCNEENYPYIRIFNDGHFSFTFSSGKFWRDDSCKGSLGGNLGLGANLIYIPPSLLTKENFELPLDLEDVLLFVAAQADVSVSDSQGHSVSTSGGGNIPGAFVLPVPMDRGSFAIMILPVGKDYQVRFEGWGERPMLGIINGKIGQQLAIFAKTGSSVVLNLSSIGPALGFEIKGSFDGVIGFLTKTKVHMADISSGNVEIGFNGTVPLENLYLLRGKLSQGMMQIKPYPDGSIYLSVPGNNMVLSSFSSKITENGDFVHYEKVLSERLVERVKPLISGEGLDEILNPIPPSSDSWINWSPVVSEKVRTKINGLGGKVFVDREDSLKITLSSELDQEGILGDYFLWVKIPAGMCYCYHYPNEWRECPCDDPSPAYQGALISFDELPFLELPSASMLPEGNYTLFFAIDKNSDGYLKGDVLRDVVNFEIR